jgi:hypothetical protein
MDDLRYDGMMELAKDSKNINDNKILIGCTKKLIEAIDKHSKANGRLSWALNILTAMIAIGTLILAFK